KNNWHATLRVHHLSNAGLSDDNAGANTVNLAVGYRF
ncbi:MAG: acyloxyacyl hydrolase, partial [Candidatus Hydrogenedentes bacterium]|nr:acyloxyacyl hydrolase [Candidatus Hydrogenedentota bacterium]